MSTIPTGIPASEVSPAGTPQPQHRLARAIASVPVKTLLSVLAALVALLLREYIARFTGPLPPFVVFNPTVLGIALWAGVWYGLTTSAVAALLVLWTLSPAGTLRITYPADIFSLVHFCIGAVAISVLSELYRRGQLRFTRQAVAEQRKIAEKQTRIAEALGEQATRLRSTEEFLTMMVDFVPQIVWMCTPDGNSVYFNKRWTDFTGLTLAETMGQNWSKPFHPEDVACAWRTWVAASRKGDIFEIEVRIRAADGNYRWHLWRGAPVRDDDGAIFRWFGTGTDIEDLKRTDEELQLTKQRFELALRPTPVTVFNQDLDLKITWVYNPAPEFDAAQILGKRERDFLEDRAEAEAIEEIKRRALSTGASQREVVTVHVGGNACVYDLVVEPLRDASGKITGITCATIEITERTHHEHLLKDTLARFRAIYSATLEYIGILSADGKLLDCNDAALHFARSTREEVVGKPFWEGPWFAYTDGMPQRVRAAVQQAAAGETVRTEALLTTPSGEPLSFDFSLTPVRNAEGKVAFIVPEAREVTDLKRAQEALMRSEKLAAVGRLASSIAHEINNPLEAVMNVLYLARGEQSCSDILLGYLDLADEELQRVAHVTRQTLGFYREAVAPITVPLIRIIESAVDLHRRKILERNATVSKQYRGDLQVTAIPGELRQVISNLLANSLDAIESGGQITIRASRGNSRRNGKPLLRIIVADNGSGIGPENVARIFEPLFTTKVLTGSGLGLWVVRQLVEKHGGTIGVHTCTTGAHRGTSFTITLPGN